eukprot:CAMPEP_0185857738 /NCGR_PEP_ID=MMETSP1354-20130828/29655_1 /TAXON_ID=708628 /ORGANISM="Erythrolobus madagascarensis, Strain CCMP3276" /LENGTH=344 /DNA_ID=CAMNT_0028560009 /DNA_START=46 /DNA_END=1080 /DNA_ORIENTATION=-
MMEQVAFGLSTAGLAPWIRAVDGAATGGRCCVVGESSVRSMWMGSRSPHAAAAAASARRACARRVVRSAAAAAASGADGEGQGGDAEVVNDGEPIPQDGQEPIGDEGEEADDGIAAMLNSPEFLRKKLEIVQNELEEADDGIAAMLNSPEFLRKKLEIVQNELAEERKKNESAEEALAQEKDSYIRLAADFENFRKRNQKELSESAARATVVVLKQLLTVLDNFELAEEAVKPSTPGEESIKNSYSGINRQLLDMLVKLGVEPIESVGQPFDPMRMDAISTAPSDTVHEGSVMAQMKRGYALGELVVRAAMVVVSAGPGPAGGAVPSETDAAPDAGTGGTVNSA